ncbi:pre-60S ribosomal particles component [Dimargaris verticillata]|uniref:Pre-60S ribosomal particles component n=1 Tax=Dimargaris verticillata TaxID=2761393 RepID=A0A9W8B4V1_9FUNG|nr:pre-60S ribosomal particles component [Dimargaris verticillata]
MKPTKKAASGKRKAKGAKSEASAPSKAEPAIVPAENADKASKSKQTSSEKTTTKVESNGSDQCSAGSGSDSESGDSDSDIERLTKQKKKKPKKNDPQDFANAMVNILGTKLKAADKSTPILSKNRLPGKLIDDEKLELRAQKTLTAERQREKNVNRVIPDFSNAEYEKKLRKVATRGVIRLFNAVNSQQNGDALSVVNSSAADNERGNVSDLSKDRFLELLKSGNAE